MQPLRHHPHPVAVEASLRRRLGRRVGYREEGWLLPPAGAPGVALTALAQPSVPRCFLSPQRACSLVRAHAVRRNPDTSTWPAPCTLSWT
jgi:hypothetical protein